MNRAEGTVRELLRFADIKINGSRPWDIQVHNEKFYKRSLEGSLGFGESYMDGDWDCKKLDEAMFRIISADLESKIKKSFKMILFLAIRKLTNVASKNRAFQVGKKHYDLGNELYELMLDQNMNYSCGYWKSAKNLDQAQIDKMNLICRKLYLKKGMSVLDIGSGWGNFAYYAAKNFGVKVTGITVSREQAKLARIRCKGLPVKFKVMDYRDLANNKYDRIVSIGMFEHVTYKNYETFMQVVSDSLKGNGLFLLHTIGKSKSNISGDPWVEKYIFPNSQIPSLAQIGKAAEGKFITEDFHNFGYYYYPTLMSWWRNFSKNWTRLKKINPKKYNVRFYRMWRYYLHSFAGAFKSNKLQLFQLVLSKGNNQEVYSSVR